MRKIIGFLALAVLAAACSGDGSATSSTSSATSVTSSSLAVSTTSGSSTTTAVATTTTTTSAAPTEALGVELLVAGPDGVFLVSEDGSTDVLVNTPATFAIDDLSGGVLFQRQRWLRERQSIVYRVRSNGTDAVQTLVPTPEQGLTLNGAATIGEDTFVYYSRNEGTTVDDTGETLRRYSLATREVTELRSIGGWESGSFPISISDSLILYNWSGEGIHGMRFSDLEANDAAVAANPTPPDGYEGCFECPHFGELSHDGTRIVYWEFDRGQQAVIRHVASGAEVRRITLPMAGDDLDVVSFDLSADYLVVNLVSVDEREPAPAMVYDLTKVNPEPVRLAVAGEAYITLAPVMVVGPVTGP